jgi:hypothetical protein
MPQTPQTPRIPCDVLLIAFPDMSTFHEDQRDAIFRTATQLSNFLDSPRRAFTGIARLGNALAGFYVEEGQRQGLHGDTPTNLALTHDSNFQKLFFALLPDRGCVILQKTSLHDYVDLNYSSMRNDFFELLTQMLNRAGIPVARIQWSKYYKQRTQEEMRRLFFGSTARSMDVVGLYRQAVREEIQLANPDPSEELLLKRIYNKEFETIDEESLKAGPDGDLRNTKTGKAAIGAGNIRKIVSVMPSGETETFYIEQDEKVELPIDTNKSYVTSTEIHDTIEIVERRIIIPVSIINKQHPLSDLGPLFRLTEDKRGKQ